MISREEIEIKIKDLIVDKVGVTSESVEPEVDLVNGFGHGLA